MTRTRANLILTGFMGTGKSTVGRQVAKHLGRPFVDMDATIEARQGRSIPQIFEAEGEAYFRRLERALCLELAGQSGLVIATGGGALVDGDNLATMSATGLVICLTCPPDVLWQRLATSQDRPMLQPTDRRAQMEALLARRQPAYARIRYQIDTGRQSTAETVAAVLAVWRDWTAAPDFSPHRQEDDGASH